MTCKVFSCIAGMFVFCFSLSAASINVPGDYATIQEGIDSAAVGDTVLVAAGEYIITTPINFNGKAITVQSEEGAGETTIRMAEEPSDIERASVVIFESEEAEASVLDGCILAGVKGIRQQRGYRGGGLLCINGSSPTIIKCMISGN
jgi:hypothetical protein